MRLIGLLGGVASGKSFVASELARRGAVVLDADRLGHEVLRQNDVLAALRLRWGTTIFTPAGEVARSAVAQIVFGQSAQSAAELRFLEQLTHPRIGAALEQQLQALRQQGTAPLAVLDAPVMLKGGWDRYCDAILFIDAAADIRLARAFARGWTPEQFAAREAAQEPVAEKQRHATHTLDNNGPPAATQAALNALWPQLVSP